MNWIHEGVAISSAFTYKFFETEQIQVTAPTSFAIGGIENVELLFHLSLTPLISLPKKFLNLLHHFHEPVHFGLSVVKIKTRAGGQFHFAIFKTGFQIRRRENAGRW
jgi:hypothetical protein